MYDVVIIGAGVSGSACARELSKYNLSICVVEKEEDVCCGTSKANSAIVHSGIDCKTGRDLKFLIQRKHMRWSRSCLMRWWQLFTARQEALYVRLA